MRDTDCRKVNGGFTVWVNRFPLRVFRELTTTITAFVVLFAPMSGAVFSNAQALTG